MDAWGARDLSGALAACQSDLEHGADPFAVTMRLSSQVALVRQARALSEEGLGAKDIAKRLRKHEFRVRKALGHADNYSRDELDDAVVRLAALDAALKGSSRLTGELELELALVELVARPESVGASFRYSSRKGALLDRYGTLLRRFSGKRHAKHLLTYF